MAPGTLRATEGPGPRIDHVAPGAGRGIEDVLLTAGQVVALAVLQFIDLVVVGGQPDAAPVEGLAVEHGQALGQGGIRDEVANQEAPNALYGARDPGVHHLAL